MKPNAPNLNHNGPEHTDIYKRMIEEIQDYAIILMDRNGIILNWNKGAQKIKRYSESEIRGKHFSIFYLEEDLKNNLPQKLMNQAAETGRAGQEGWRKRKDGTKFWGSITITAVHDDGNVIAFCKVTRDLTDKKIAEDNLRLSEERYHRMVAEVQDYAIILLDSNGIIENWNAGAENIKGYAATEVIGKKIRAVLYRRGPKKWTSVKTAQRGVYNGKSFARRLESEKKRNALLGYNCYYCIAQ